MQTTCDPRVYTLFRAARAHSSLNILIELEDSAHRAWLRFTADHPEQASHSPRAQFIAQYINRRVRNYGK